MVRILEAIASLRHGEELEAIMDREPLMLYAELERRGFAWQFGERDGQLILTVTRGSP